MNIMMKMVVNKKKYILVDIFITIAVCFSSFADTTVTDLSRIQPNWVCVLGGNALCNPVRTSYGYAVVGEGKMVSAFTSSGSVLWQRSFTKSIQPFLSVGIADMLYVVSGTSKLTMLNPGGVVLWTVDTGFPVLCAPLVGKDGRIFVKGNNDLSCYGTKGVRRWYLKTDAQDSTVSPAILNDGSLLVFLARTENGKSIASRVSPFGEIFEQITFTARIRQAVSCSNGVLLTFADGSAGFCSVKNGSLDSRWVMQSGNGTLTSPTAASTDGFSDGRAALISGSPAQISIIDTETGKILSTFKIQGLDTATLTYAGASLDGLVFADRTMASCVETDGAMVWSAQCGQLKKWNYLFPTDGGYLAFCGTNWVIEAYRMKQTLHEGDASSFTPPHVSAYVDFYEKTNAVSSMLTGRAISSDQVKTMSDSFSKGDFGTEEKKYLPLLQNEMDSLAGSWENSSTDHLDDKPYFRTNIVYTEELLSLAGNSGTALFQKYIATLIRQVQDPSLLKYLIQSAGTISFDPNEEMLYSLNTVLHRTSPKNITLLLSVCDSVYAICKYMGRPAFFDYGQEMLSSLLYPQYDAKIRAYARSTMERIAKLKL